LDAVDDLGARRQIGQHLGLGSAQQEGRHQTSQAAARGLVALAFDGGGIALAELPAAAQQARVEQVHDRPQVGEPVFHRGAGERQLEARRQRGHGLDAFGGGVFQRLRFVQHQRGPFACGKGLGVDLRQRVTGNHQVEGGG